MICGHEHEQKFKYPNPRDSKIIQMPYPRAKAIDENPALCPASPPPPPFRLDIDRCIISASLQYYGHPAKIKERFYFANLAPVVRKPISTNP